MDRFEFIASTHANPQLHDPQSPWWSTVDGGNLEGAHALIVGNPDATALAITGDLDQLGRATLDMLRVVNDARCARATGGGPESATTPGVAFNSPTVGTAFDALRQALSAEDSATTARGGRRIASAVFALVEALQLRVVPADPVSGDTSEQVYITVHGVEVSARRRADDVFVRLDKTRMVSDGYLLIDVRSKRDTIQGGSSGDPDVPAVRLEWTTTEYHGATLTVRQLAELLGVPQEELAGVAYDNLNSVGEGGLLAGLADIECDDTRGGVERELDGVGPAQVG